MAEPNFDIERAQRWFAVELNNIAWGYVEAASRTDSETESMIHAAHGSCFHWLQIGGGLNHLRAQCLLTTAYAVAQLGEAAVRHAETCLTLSEAEAGAMTPFDRACVQGCVAVAFLLAGDSDGARKHFESLRKLYSDMPDGEDQMVIEQLYLTVLRERLSG